MVRPIRESAVEAALGRFARENGIWTRKFSSPAHRGVPDRIFMRSGKILFLEIKRPGEKPTALQLHELQQIRSAGGNADWCDSVDTGKVAISLYLNDAL